MHWLSGSSLYVAGALFYFFSPPLVLAKVNNKKWTHLVSFFCSVHTGSSQICAASRTHSAHLLLSLSVSAVPKLTASNWHTEALKQCYEITPVTRFRLLKAVWVMAGWHVFLSGLPVAVQYHKPCCSSWLGYWQYQLLYSTYLLPLKLPPQTKLLPVGWRILNIRFARLVPASVSTGSTLGACWIARVWGDSLWQLFENCTMVKTSCYDLAFLGSWKWNKTR